MSAALFLSITAIGLVWAIVIYNRIIAYCNKSDAAWSDIDVQLQRRFDLVPNLVTVVKAYATHEKTALENISMQRSNNSNIAQRTHWENQLAQQIRTLMVVVEQYPDLKASANFADLHKSLIAVEDDIQFARRYYNGNIRDYNTQIESFPAFIVARLFSFKRRDFFEIDLVTQRDAPLVSL